MSFFGELLSYGFMIRALICGILVSLCCSLLGVSLVLKRFSMIGDGLSHVGFGALAVAAAIGASPLWIAIPVVVLSSVLLLRITESSKWQGDSAIAVFSTAALAIGVIIVSKSGTNNDLSSYMFGSILSVSRTEAIFSIILSVLVIGLYVMFYPRLFAVTFDESFAAATGTNTGLYRLLLSVLTSLCVVLGMQLMGTLLISSLIIFPALSAMRLFRTFRGVTVGAAVLSVLCFIGGIAVSFWLNFPTGATVVAVQLAALLLSVLFSRFHKKTAA